MMQHKDAALEIREVTSTGSFAGYGSVFGNVDQYGDIVEKGAFADSLAQWSNKGALPAMLWQHRSGEPIGAYTAMREDDGGLYVEGKLALKTQRGAEAYELLGMKAISGLSIGFLTRDDSTDQKTGIRTIKAADLWEVSLVTFPANDAARVQAVKSLDEVSDLKSAERWLRDAAGLSRTEATAVVSRIKAIARDAAKADESNAELIAALRRNIAIFSK